MKKSLLLVLSLFLPLFVISQTVFINEIHYDNDGGDSGEGVEIAGPAGTDLSTYSIVAYNGNGGASYSTTTLTGTLPDQQNGFGTLWFAIVGLQNGAPDGLALVNNGTTLIQFLSYEGSFAATDGVASGTTSTDIGVSELGTSSVGHSLQLSGTGNLYTDFTWQGSASATTGATNNGQSFTASGADTDPPVFALNSPRETFVVDTKVGLGVEIDEPGTAYYILVVDGSTAPSSTDVKAGIDYSGVTVLKSGSIVITEADTEYTTIIEGLTASTAYDVYVVAEDDEGTPNIQAAPAMVDITTTGTRALDITAPIGPGNYNIGDTIEITWTSANIDFVYVGVYSHTAGQAFYVYEDENGDPVPIAASVGMYDLWIPHDADEDDYDVRIYDVYDTTFQDSEGAFTVTDNRAVAFVEPQENDIYYLGDTVIFEWTHTDLDSILLGSYIYEEDETMIFTSDDQTGEWLPIEANRDTLTFVIPLDTPVDSAGLFIFDYYDTSFNAGPVKVYLMDTIKPRIEETLPMNNEIGVPLLAPLHLTFTESVDTVTGKKIYLKKADGTLVEEFKIGNVFHNNDDLVIKPSSPLEPGVSYYVEMDAGIAKDRKDLEFGGISGDGTWKFTAATSDLYFSEYIEGSSNNKALEIFNNTGSTVDLDNYAIWRISNGGDWFEGMGNDVPLAGNGELLNGEVFVICNSSAITEIQDVSDIIGTTATYFNGDDAMGLAKRYGNNWVLIDQVGEEGADPGTGWDVAGVTNATANHTLLRKSEITIGSVDWASSAGTNKTDSEWKVFDIDYIINLGAPTPLGSDLTEFVSFALQDTTLNNVTLSSTIDNTAGTIDVEILFGYDTQLDSLVAIFTLSDGATADIMSGDTLDFTSPLVIQVTAEDQITTKDFTVNVTVSSTASAEAELTSFTFADPVANGILDSGGGTVTVTVPYGTDITALTPTFEVSAGATVSPLSGVSQDFTNPVDYTVTAQDGTTTKVWTVTVSWEVVPAKEIYDIQYTTDPSGDSPLKDTKVKVSGVITSLNIYQSELKGYFIQDSDSAWSGLYVYDPNRDQTDNPQVGDSITVVGTVEEYYNATQVGYVEYYNHEKTGLTVTPIEVATGSAGIEKWEDVLLRFVGAEVIANDLGYDEVSVNDGTGSALVDDFLYNYTASSDFTVGNTYHIVGVMYYTFGDFKLMPRSADDISDVTGIPELGSEGDFMVYPNPSSGQFNLEFTTQMSGNFDLSISNITGKVIYMDRLQNVEGKRVGIDIGNQPSGFYFIRISNSSQSIVKKIVIH